MTKTVVVEKKHNGEWLEVTVGENKYSVEVQKRSETVVDALVFERTNTEEENNKITRIAAVSLVDGECTIHAINRKTDLHNRTFNKDQLRDILDIVEEAFGNYTIKTYSFE